MRSYLRGEEGVSLIMTLIMLVVVGILAAAFMRASVFNINFSQGQLNQKIAFYAAEAGVEHRLSGEMSDDELGEEISLDDYYERENLEVRYKVAQNENGNIYESTGTVNDEFEQVIEFSRSRAVEDLAVLIDKLSVDTFYKAKTSHTSTSEDEPGYGDDYEELWEEVDGEYIEDEDIELEDISEWKIGVEYNPGDIVVNIQDYVDFRGKEDEFSTDNISLFNLTDKYDNWEELKEDYFNEFGFVENEEDREDDEFLRREMEKIEEGEIVDENILFSPVLELGDDEEYVIWRDDDTWKDDEEKNEGDILYNVEDIVYHAGKYYEATEEIILDNNNEDPSESQGNKPWEELDGDQEINSVDIKESIILVDGTLRLRGNVNLESSLILVRDTVDFGGNTNLNDSLILSLNESKSYEPLTTTGNPSIDLKPVTEDTYSDWPGISDLLPDDLEFILTLNYWRPK